MNRDDISPAQRARLAYVYIRQSSSHQVRMHRESQRRQRSLVDRAVELGWRKERIVEVDEDLGRSAGRGSQRLGFRDMVAQTALGKIGVILAIEVSRVSRVNHDWYHLLDICAVTRTLIADAEGVYDPRAYNDRLLLGLKGTLSEAELHIMKERLVEATREKAKRGEFHFRLPVGYVWDELGRMQKSPDEQIVSTLVLIFERFDRLGTVHQAQCSLAEEEILVPVSLSKSRVAWQRPSYRYVHRVLTNPLYAGAYVYGQVQSEEALDASQRPMKRRRRVSREDWHVLLADHHEGYITWEKFERNQARIISNRRVAPGQGAAREGESLLQGLVLCGRCGRRMKVAYSGLMIRYRCVEQRRQMGAPVCQVFGALRLERAVEALVMECLEPLGMEAMLEAASAYVHANEAERAHWQQRVERAGYEVGVARRRYEAVEPENRLLARDLERRLERALDEQERVRAEADLRLASLERPLSEAEGERLRGYARDLSRLWNAPTTRPQDRKRIVRCLIQDVVVTVLEQEAQLKAEVHWRGGEVTRVELAKTKSGLHRHVAEPELVELVRDLAGEFSDAQIARILHRKRLKTAKGLPFTSGRVANLRHTHGIEPAPRLARDGEDIYTAQQAADLLGVTDGTVIRWVEAGLLRGGKFTDGAPWRIRVTAEDRHRLTAADAPEGWLPLKAAALKLAVSQQTVLQKLKSGELEGVRVRVGRRSAWRIRCMSSSSENQTSLFERTPL